MTPSDEIMEEARRIGQNWFGEVHHDSEALAVEVADALKLATERERQRCFDAVKRVQDACDREGVKGFIACTSIAAAIERG